MGRTSRKYQTSRTDNASWIHGEDGTGEMLVLSRNCRALLNSRCRYVICRVPYREENLGICALIAPNLTFLSQYNLRKVSWRYGATIICTVGPDHCTQDETALQRFPLNISAHRVLMIRRCRRCQDLARHWRSTGACASSICEPIGIQTDTQSVNLSISRLN